MASGLVRVRPGGGVIEGLSGAVPAQRGPDRQTGAGVGARSAGPRVGRSAGDPDLKPQEGIWSLVKGEIGNLGAADLTEITRAVRRRLKRIRTAPSSSTAPKGRIVWENPRNGLLTISKVKNQAPDEEGMATSGCGARSSC
ncbi:hypothetical protein SCOCK_150139 [Actinacidiphila cocklensis]|uniref:Transposase n=1 Tax=Actinacidiphila cocklensis TaxID=887465 RepID=A0A9W4DL54_9ACTN|nr:hypothetical protein SCOCK_150139 [Actinacidiphila cocklensis]